jgi:hypothetical protein
VNTSNIRFLFGEEERDASVNSIVKFPTAPEWASRVDAKTIDLLIVHGYLRHDQRHNWCAVEMAVNSAFYAAVFDGRPELSLQRVIEYMLRKLTDIDQP